MLALPIMDIVGAVDATAGAAVGIELYSEGPPPSNAAAERSEEPCSSFLGGLLPRSVLTPKTSASEAWARTMNSTNRNIQLPSMERKLRICYLDAEQWSKTKNIFCKLRVS